MKIRKDRLRKHIALVHNKNSLADTKLVKCPYCSKSFSKRYIDNHIEEVHNNKRLKSMVISRKGKPTSSVLSF